MNSKLPCSIDVQSGTVVLGDLAKHEVIDGWAKHPISVPVSMRSRPDVRTRIEERKANAKTFASPVAQGLFASQHKFKPIPAVLESIKYADSTGELEKLAVLISKYVDLFKQKAGTKSICVQVDALYENFMAASKSLADIINSEKPPPKKPSLQRLYALRQLELCLFQRGGMDFVDATSLAEVVEADVWEQDLYSQYKKVALDLNVSLSNVPETNKEYVLQLLKASQLFLNSDLQEKWVKFIVRLSVSPKVAGQQQEGVVYLAQMMFELKKAGVMDFYLNKVVPPVLLGGGDMKDDIANKQLALMLRSYAKNTKDFIEKNSERKELIGGWRRRVAQWSSPKDFDELYRPFEKEYFPLLENLMKDMSRDDLDNVSKHMVAKMLVEAITIYDLALKEVIGSPDYPLKDRVKNFSTLLKRYLSFSNDFALQVIEPGGDLEGKLMFVGDIGGFVELPVDDDAAWGIDRYINRIKEIYDRYEQKLSGDLTNCNDDYFREMLHTTGVFDVSAAMIGSKIDYDRVIGGSLMAIFPALEDLFTLAHQNILRVAGLHNEKNGLKLIEFPTEVQELVATLGICRAFLLNKTVAYPFVNLEFNISLRQHSAAVKVALNQKSKPVSAEIEVSYFMAEEGNRRFNFAELSKIGCEIFGFEMIEASIDPCEPDLRDCTCVVREQKFVFKMNLDDVSLVHLRELLALIKNSTMAPIECEVNEIDVIPDEGFLEYGIKLSDKLIDIRYSRLHGDSEMPDDFRLDIYYNKFIESIFQRLDTYINAGNVMAMSEVKEKESDFNRFSRKVIEYLFSDNPKYKDIIKVIKDFAEKHSPDLLGYITDRQPDGSSDFSQGVFRENVQLTVSPKY